MVWIIAISIIECLCFSVGKVMEGKLFSPVMDKNILYIWYAIFIVCSIGYPLYFFRYLALGIYGAAYFFLNTTAWDFLYVLFSMMLGSIALSRAKLLKHISDKEMKK